MMNPGHWDSTGRRNGRHRKVYFASCTMNRAELRCWFGFCAAGFAAQIEPPPAMRLALWSSSGCGSPLGIGILFVELPFFKFLECFPWLRLN